MFEFFKVYTRLQYIVVITEFLLVVIRYIAPEQVPVQYGGLSKEGETEFTTADSATEETIKPTGKHTVELPITEVGFILELNWSPNQ